MRAEADARFPALTADPFGLEWEPDAPLSDETVAPAPAEGWRARAQRLRAPAMRVALFAAGVAAAFLAILLYQAVTPKPHEVTTQEVNDTVAHALASVTPLPAFSEGVYQVIQPSLVLIQAKLPEV